MSYWTRIICEGCGFPLGWCSCKGEFFLRRYLKRLGKLLKKVKAGRNVQRKFIPCEPVQIDDSTIEYTLPKDSSPDLKGGSGVIMMTVKDGVIIEFDGEDLEDKPR